MSRRATGNTAANSIVDSQPLGSRRAYPVAVGDRRIGLQRGVGPRGRILSAAGPEHPSPSSPGATAASRLHNWRSVIRAIAKLGLRVRAASCRSSNDRQPTLPCFASRSSSGLTIAWRPTSIPRKLVVVPIDLSNESLTPSLRDYPRFGKCQPLRYTLADI
jgi:hypothetical protein